MLKGHESYVFDIGDLHNYQDRERERDIKTHFFVPLHRKLWTIMFLQSTVVLDERPCWFVNQYGVNRKMDRLDVSGMSIVGGMDTKYGYLAPSRSKIIFGLYSTDMLSSINAYISLIKY